VNFLVPHHGPIPRNVVNRRSRPANPLFFLSFPFSKRWNFVQFRPRLWHEAFRWLEEYKTGPHSSTRRVRGRRMGDAFSPFFFFSFFSFSPRVAGRAWVLQRLPPFRRGDGPELGPGRGGASFFFLLWTGDWLDGLAKPVGQIFFFFSSLFTPAGENLGISAGSALRYSAPPFVSLSWARGRSGKAGARLNGKPKYFFPLFPQGGGAEAKVCALVPLLSPKSIVTGVSASNFFPGKKKGNKNQIPGGKTKTKRRSIFLAFLGGGVTIHTLSFFLRGGPAERGRENWPPPPFFFPREKRRLPYRWGHHLLPHNSFQAEQVFEEKNAVSSFFPFPKGQKESS